MYLVNDFSTRHLHAHSGEQINRLSTQAYNCKQWSASQREGTGNVESVQWGKWATVKFERLLPEDIHCELNLKLCLWDGNIKGEEISRTEPQKEKECDVLEKVTEGKGQGKVANKHRERQVGGRCCGVAGAWRILIFILRAVVLSRKGNVIRASCSYFDGYWQADQFQIFILEWTSHIGVWGKTTLLWAPNSPITNYSARWVELLCLTLYKFQSLYKHSVGFLCVPISGFGREDLDLDILFQNILSVFYFIFSTSLRKIKYGLRKYIHFGMKT